MSKIFLTDVPRTAVRITITAENIISTDSSIGRFTLPCRLLFLKFEVYPLFTDDAKVKSLPVFSAFTGGSSDMSTRLPEASRAFSSKTPSRRRISLDSSSICTLPSSTFR